MSDDRQHAEFFHAGGVLPPGSPSYIQREADQRLFGLTLAGEYCNVLTPRQMGKTSLIAHIQGRLQEEGVRTAVIDLTAIGAHEVEADAWYYSLVSAISRRLELDVDEQTWWEERGPLSSVQRFTLFVQQVLLDQVTERIAIFIDEIDSTLRLPFADDFFIAIRSMHSARSKNPAYKRLTFVLVGVARAADLIKDRAVIPYNIGYTVNLTDFDAGEARAFLAGLQGVYPGQSKAILDRVLYWTGGHPYLTQRMCAEIVGEGQGMWTDDRVDRLAERTFLQDGQIRNEPNLQWIHDYIRGSSRWGGVLRVYRDILSEVSVEDRERSIEHSQLKLSGLVKVTPEGRLTVRNRIYARVFGAEWVEAQLAELPASMTRHVVGRIPVLGWFALCVVVLGVLAATAFAWPRYIFPFLMPPSMHTPTPTVTSTAAAALTVTSTATPTQMPTQTLCPSPTPVPAFTCTPTPTGTMGLEPTATAQATSTASPTSTRTAVPPATETPVPTSTPTRVPVSTDTPVPASTPTATASSTVTLAPTPTVFPTPFLLDAPVLLEPESEARYAAGDVVRLKFFWVRRLEAGERVSILLTSHVDPAARPNWWASEQEILDGGGAIQSAEEGYRFEINYRLDGVPVGDASWQIAIMRIVPVGAQVSAWSEARPIVRTH
jgi:AAA domain-containing protein